MKPAAVEPGSRWQRSAGNRRLLLLCLLLFIASGLISCWVFFPAEVLQRRLIREAVQQTGLAMQGSNASLQFPPALQLDLTIDLPQPELKALQLSGLNLAPVWSSLFSANPAVSVQAGLAGGEFDLQAEQAGRLEAEFSKIEVVRLQQDGLAYRLQGLLGGRVLVEKISPAGVEEGQFRLQLQDSGLLGLEAFGLPTPLSLGELNVTGKLRQRRLNLAEIKLEGGVMRITGAGSILFADRPEQSRINLSLQLFPDDSTPATLRDLLSLSGAKPAADGSYQLRLGGTLARPLLR